MQVTELHTYAIKGCYRSDAISAVVEPWGVAGDRRFMVVDEDHRMLSQREEPGLVRIKPSVHGNRLTLRGDGHPDLVVTAMAGELVDTNVHSDRLKASLVSDEADAWLTSVLGRTAHLVWLDDPTRRPVDERYAAAADRVNLADGYPMLLANGASLDALNDWLAEAQSPEWPLPMTRFRPNIVVGGGRAWAEDDWVGRRIRIGEVVFRVPKPCGRCVVTTTDQDTGERGREPLFTLARHRNVDQSLLFATNLIPDTLGTIAVGDPVVVV